jgi:hypothetical protein
MFNLSNSADVTVNPNDSARFEVFKLVTASGIHTFQDHGYLLSDAADAWLRKPEYSGDLCRAFRRHR